MILRPYQTAARQQLNTLINAGRHPVFVSPTGTGKTATAVETIADRVRIGRRVYVLTPSTEIHSQWIKALVSAGLNPGSVSEGKIHGASRWVYVAMPMTLVNMLPYLPEAIYPHEIVVDECVTGDTVVDTEIGQISLHVWTKLNPKYILSYDGTKIVYQEVVRFWKKGVRPIIEITTNTGRTLKCTEEHLLFGENGWQTAATLEKGNLIFVNAGVGNRLGETKKGIHQRGFPATECGQKNLNQNGKSNTTRRYAKRRFARAGVADKSFRRQQRMNVSEKQEEFVSIAGTYRDTINARATGARPCRPMIDQNYTEHSLGTPVFSMQQNAQNLPDWHGPMVCHKRIGPNTRQKTYRFLGLNSMKQKTTGTERCQYAADPKAWRFWFRFVTHFTKMVRKPLRGNYSIHSTQKGLRGGFAMTDQPPITQSGSTRKGFQRLKTKLSQIIFKIITDRALLRKTKENLYFSSVWGVLLQRIYWLISDPTSLNVCNTRFERISGIRKLGEEPVYDLEVKKNHCYFTNGILSHNCHHGAADTWETIHRFFPDATRIGLTATPRRTDGKGLDHLYTDIVQTITPADAIDAGYLARPLPVVPRVYLGDIEIKNGEYDASAQAAALGKTQIIGDVIDNYSTVFSGLPVLVACSTFDHAADMTERFNAAGWKFEHIHSGLAYADRRRMTRQIADGTLNGLCTVGIGIEGMDIPGLYGLLWLRRTLSLTIYLQFWGRILRPMQGKPYGIGLDFVGNLFIHGYPQAERGWSLAPIDTGRGEVDPDSMYNAATMRICPFCGVANAADNTHCHFCGEDLDSEEARQARKRRLPSMIDGELVAVESDGQAEAIRERSDRIRAEQAAEAMREAAEREAGRLEEAPGIDPGERVEVLRRGLFSSGRRKLFSEAVKNYL